MPAIRRRRLPGVLAASIAAAHGAQAQAAEIRLGAIYPFTGALALPGDESFRGLELAIEQRNDQGGIAGRRIRLLRGDAPDQAQAVAEARRLIGTERVAALFGTFASPLSAAATQVAEAQGIAYFELGAIADGITDRGFRGLFRLCPRGAEIGAMTITALTDALAPAWGSEPRTLRVVILHEDAPDGASVAAAQEAELRSRGLQPAERIAYPERSAEFGPIAQRLRSAQAEVVLHSGGQNDIPLLFRGLQEAGWRPRMLIGAGAAYSLVDTARAIGPAFEGVMAVDVTPLAVAEGFAPGAAAFVELYKRRYGADPRSGHSLANYAGALACLDALREAGGTERDRLRATMLALDQPEGATPAGWGLRFDERGQNMRAQPVLSQWQGGRQVAVFPERAAAGTLRARLGAG
jgi:branched-chain amino acid transport system substrate-binding protein